jgi:pyrroline-5-carboxylate reductase
MKIVFLGGGNITSALLAGLREAGDRRRIAVHDRNAHKLRRLQREFDAVAEPDLRRGVSASDALIIAVRPGSVRELLAQVGKLEDAKIAISLAAGLPLRQLRETLGPAVHWARAMPSPVCRGSRGLTAIAFDRAMPARERNFVRELFARVGTVILIPERQFDVFSAAYSPSLGYYAVNALARAAHKLGLNARAARIAAAHALADGIQEWRETGAALEALIKEAATPGGIAAAVMAAKDQAGYQTMLERSLRVGVQRARQMRTTR